jgi:hypothetical protein
MPETADIDSTATRNARFGAGYYIAVVILAALAAYVYLLRTEGIFSCPATGYSKDTYLAYCGAPQYGDYDHGALWLGLEPGIQQSPATADVLFLGNSRMQFGLSSDTTDQWFASAQATYFLMGFAYWENYNFEWPLLKRLKVRPKVYVVNMDLFFNTLQTPPALSVMHDADVYAHYRRKRLWQISHRVVCARTAAACGNNEAFYRSIQTGAYLRKGGDVGRFPVSYDSSIDPKIAADYIKRGREFFASIPVDRKCVLITLVPSLGTKAGTTRAIADALGIELIAPQIADLTMFDHSHLDRPSAERWSRAFFEAAGPKIRQCLGTSAVTAG